MLILCKLSVLSLALGVLPTAVYSLTNYANDFVDPDYIVGKKFPANTAIAQRTIVRWADQYAAFGPWSTCPAPFISFHGIVLRIAD